MGITYPEEPLIRFQGRRYSPRQIAEEIRERTSIGKKLLAALINGAGSWEGPGESTAWLRKACRNALEKVEESGNVSVGSEIQEEEILDWEAAMLSDPPRPSGTLQVTLSYEGRSKPIPEENPWAQESIRDERAAR
jgi:hypothetical protein